MTREVGMRALSRAVASFVAAIALPAAAQTQSVADVAIADGTLRGIRNGEVASFKDIPFAAPPIGPLRWQAPQPPARWKGTRAADRYGAICQQKVPTGDAGVGALPMSEDCLTLNVFTPVNAKRAPVLFWIHGGGYVNGSGTAPLYDGSSLARKGVVVVTINYRLGRFGFFAHPALSAEANGAPVGNYALMDMIAALKWVRANIARFGGDPSQVTISGESAGGVAVNELMVIQSARPLFARAIVESGLGRETTLPLAEAERKGEAFGAELGHVHASTSELRALTAEQILKAGDPDLFSGGTAMIDGKILTTSPLAGFRAGQQASVPYIVGWNNLEFPVPAAVITAKFDAKSPLTPASLKLIKRSYPDVTSYEDHLVSDVLFVEPALMLARLHADKGYPTWVYQFSVLAKSASAALKGTPHAMERQYVFETLHTSSFPTDANDAKQAQLVSSYWANFTKTGNPNTNSRPFWPRFRGSDEKIIDFTNAGPEVGAIPRRQGLDAITGAFKVK